MTSKELAILNEGSEHKPYTDTKGKITIGIGRNLSDVGLSDDEIDFLFQNDIKRAENGLLKYLPWSEKLDKNSARYSTLRDLAFNMGIVKLLSFSNTLAFYEKGEYSKAADNLILSKWYNQVGYRGPRIVNMIRFNIFPEGD